MQLGLLGREPLAFDPTLSDVTRIELAHGAWIEYAESFVHGHAALFERLLAHVAWQETTQRLYDRQVVTPRLVASIDDLRTDEPILREIAAALSRRYGAAFDRITFALYRDGRDSVAWHRDRVLRRQKRGLVATVSVGEPRAFAIRPHGGGAPALRHQLGWGDLMVMGGTCQVTYEHTVPKARHAHGPRIAIMFRHSAPLD
jgi:alkylated DNA repair dioxygenase AlkB